MGGSLGINSGRSTSGSSAKPGGGFAPYAKQIGQGILDPSQRAGIFSQIMLSPENFNMANEQYLKYASGQDLNPLNDPNTKAMMDAVWAKSQQGINQNLANLEGSMARAGLTSPASSARLQQMQNQMTTRGMENYQAQVLPQLLSLGESAKGRQFSALGALNQQNMLPYNIFNNAMSNFKKGSSASSDFAIANESKYGK